MLSVPVELRVRLSGVRSLPEAAGNCGGECPQTDGQFELRRTTQGMLRDKQESDNRMPTMRGQILQCRMPERGVSEVIAN